MTIQISPNIVTKTGIMYTMAWVVPLGLLQKRIWTIFERQFLGKKTASLCEAEILTKMDKTF